MLLHAILCLKKEELRVFHVFFFTLFWVLVLVSYWNIVFCGFVLHTIVWRLSCVILIFVCFLGYYHV